MNYYWSDDDETPKPMHLTAIQRWRINNRQRMLATMKKYYEDHRSELLQKRRERYNNREKLQLQEIVTCPVCGVSLKKSSLYKHRRAKYHQNYERAS